MISELYVILPQILFGICAFIQITLFAYYKNNKYKNINYQNDDIDNDKESINIKEKPVKIVEKEII